MSGAMPVDFGHSCAGGRPCTLHNIHCSYPECEKGQREPAARPHVITHFEPCGPISDVYTIRACCSCGWKSVSSTEQIPLVAAFNSHKAAHTTQ